MNMRSLHRVPTSLSLILGVGLLASCVESGGEGEASPEASEAQAPAVTLGPVDGHDLPPTELERVAVGTLAPDFSLESIAGDTVTLSAFRGARNVILVFYRGHW